MIARDLNLWQECSHKLRAVREETPLAFVLPSL